MYASPIIRMTAGVINQINDAVVGMPAAPFGVGNSKFAGQLGTGAWLDDANILFNSAIGTVYGGHFRYVRLAAAATAVVVGQIVFWDTLVNVPPPGGYQVTTSEAGSADGAVLSAGIVLNPNWTPGNYSVIQDVGLCFVKFRTTLTQAGAAGSRAFAAAAGAGADNGTADVIDAATASTFATTSQQMGRFLGISADTPTNGGLKRVYINMHNVRG